MASSPRLPASVDRDRFEVGVNIAATPGAVVLRTELFELIRYAPQTPTVREQPLLIVPPMVNKYYLVDLALSAAWSSTWCARASRSSPCRGATRRPSTATGGWTRTPTARWRRSTPCWRSPAPSACIRGQLLGGALVSMLAARAGALGRLDAIGSITTGVSVLDSYRAGTASAFMGPEIAKLAVAGCRPQGVP